MGICRDINHRPVMENEVQARLILWFIGAYTSAAKTRFSKGWTWGFLGYFSIAQTYFQEGARVDSFHGQS